MHDLSNDISASAARDGDRLRTEREKPASQLTRFTRWCAQKAGCTFADQHALHDFSVRHFRTFWKLFLEWAELRWDGRTEPACTDDRCEHARFFPGLRLNYAENLLSPRDGANDAAPALTAVHADGRKPDRLTRGALRQRVARLAAWLSAYGIEPGERLVAVVNNDAEAVIACLATAAIGASFSSASPEMGTEALLARFAQLDPALLFYTTRTPGPRQQARAAELIRGMPGLRGCVVLGDAALPDLAVPQQTLAQVLATSRPPEFAWRRFGFNHPLFILFSSGTTGRPKCIVHGAGGTLLEHVKEHRLHGDLRPGETLFFHTSCAWMMWNWQLSALACGAGIVLFDGPVAGPETLWRIVADQQVTLFGTSPAYLKLCQDRGFRPDTPLPALRAVLSTGSILYDTQFDWVMQTVKDVPVQSISGGTDIIGCFVLGSPDLPVRRGTAQCRSLGLDVQALAEPGEPYGELVCRTPFPSRPLGFHADPDGARFHAAYFSQHPGVWTHGDFIAFGPDGSARLFGRSDGVMNIRGIRIGPAEIYAVLQHIPEIHEAMAVEQTQPGGGRLVLLVVLRAGAQLQDGLAVRIRKAISRDCSPAHVPAVIAAVPALPVTHSGKPSESAARAAVNGEPVRNREALANPACLAAIAGHAALRLAQPVAVRDGATDEQALQAIWEQAFGVTPIAPDDDFFELGGHSLLAMTIFAAIRDRFGCDLPISTLFAAPSISSLARTLRDSARQRFSCLVPVLPGEGRRLFLVHGLSGTVLELAELLRALRGGPPVSVLQAAGLEPGTQPDRSVEAMAERYVAAIRAAQPKGPYALFGFSFGGLIAYEMARQLAAAGETAVLPGLIDTDVHPRHLTWRETLAYRRRRLALLARGLASDPRNALAEELTRFGNTVRLRLGATPRWRDPVLVQLPPALRTVRAACEQAYTDYRIAPYSGRVTFFRASVRDPRLCDPLPVWRRRATVDVVSLTGAHLELVHPPHATGLATAMQTAAARFAEPEMDSASAETGASAEAGAAAESGALVEAGAPAEAGASAEAGRRPRRSTARRGERPA